MALGLLLASGNAQSAFFERLLMPGPLASAHAELEDDCNNCHADADKASQGELCLDCHDHRGVAKDIELGVGLHGRLGELKAKGCRLCHGEHRGRDADIVGFQPLTFDHGRTDFALRDAHAATPCSGCHEAGRKYSEAPQRCVDCHDKHDAHNGRLGEHCSDCHQPTVWSKARFDHAEATDYELTGRHAEAPCKLCHLDDEYREIDTACVACHRIDDRHLGRNGAECDLCHTAREWDSIEFDHARETRFSLRGRHAKVACEACHRPTDPKRKRDRDCLACHRSDDVHKGRNGTDCKECHNDRDWNKSDFDHFRATRFRLAGAHAKLACLACHKGAPKDDKDRTACADCHAPGPVHRDHMSEDCKDCHEQKDWQETGFDHARKTRFALDGGHESTDCVRCHSLPVAQQKLSSECYDCHRRDDPHAGELGSQCQACHEARDWLATTFDHDLTRFPLLGQHAVLTCEQCHDSADFAGALNACDACHADADPHRGSLGNGCQGCHNPNAWSAWLFEHESATGYALNGPHQDLRCQDCHTGSSGPDVMRSGACAACHRSDDIHNGGFGTQCGRCHLGDSFTDVQLPTGDLAR